MSPATPERYALPRLSEGTLITRESRFERIAAECHGGAAVAPQIIAAGDPRAVRAAARLLMGECSHSCEARQ
jgi:hypothetical protein